jgi:hypothetical protein
MSGGFGVDLVVDPKFCPALKTELRKDYSQAKKLFFKADGECLRWTTGGSSWNKNRMSQLSKLRVPALEASPPGEQEK